MADVTKETADAYNNKWVKRDLEQLGTRIRQLQAEITVAQKEVSYQQSKINIRDSHLRERCEKVRQLQADLAAAKQEGDVMWEGLNTQVADLQAELAEKDIRIEFLEAQLSKYFNEPQGFTSGEAGQVSN